MADATIDDDMVATWKANYGLGDALAQAVARGKKWAKEREEAEKAKVKNPARSKAHNVEVTGKPPRGAAGAR